MGVAYRAMKLSKVIHSEMTNLLRTGNLKIKIYTYKTLINREL